jgi:hypothetical protein
MTRRAPRDARQARLAYELAMRRLRVGIAWLSVVLLASLLRTTIDGVSLALAVADIVTAVLLLSAVLLRRTGRRLEATSRGARAVFSEGRSMRVSEPPTAPRGDLPSRRRG